MGSKARSIGAGFKLFYYGEDSKRNGVGVVLKEEFVRNVLEVKRVSDRVMSLKLEIEGVMLNVVSGYAPQVGCEVEEKERFWSELDEVIESINTGERVVIGVDFNGHVGEGVKDRNREEKQVVEAEKGGMLLRAVQDLYGNNNKDRYVARTGVTGAPPWSQAWGWGTQASAWWLSLCLRDSARHSPKKRRRPTFP
ncbi:hypothetical protein QTP86_024835 [Hemibagrus guttatus]|nr:hypothetical protein QTP86_024835 [Hemibagrus guttatus]